MSLFRLGIVIAAVMMLSGCIATNLIPDQFRSPQAIPKSKPSVGARADVQTADDDTTESDTGNVQALQSGSGGSVQAASSPPALKVGRADLLGGWKVTSGNDNCQLFMSLTGWAGGYRASTKGCSSPVLADVQAWNMNGEEIGLLSGSGDTVVRLTASEKTRLSGKTNDGEGVIVFR